MFQIVSKSRTDIGSLVVEAEEAIEEVDLVIVTVPQIAVPQLAEMFRARRTVAPVVNTGA